MDPCPCGSGAPYQQCCGTFHRGEAQPRTAEALMRSRYSAYARARIGYLESTLHPRRRKSHDPEQTREWAEGSTWLGLEILSTSDAGPDPDLATVEFVARYRPDDGEETEHHEIAEFRREDGRWYFVDGKTIGPEPVRREAPKVGRNDPCPCGSGKKYKKCCGRA